MLINIYSKLNKFFELIKPYKKIEDNLKQKESDGDLFPATNKKDAIENNQETFEGGNLIKNGKKSAKENKKAKEEEEKQKEEKAPSLAQSKLLSEEKGAEEKAFIKTEPSTEKKQEGKEPKDSVLNNFIENVRNFYTSENKFFNFETKHSANFSYRMPDEIHNEGQNIYNNKDTQNIANKIQVTEFKNIQNKTSTNVINSSSNNKIASFDEFGKMLADALKSASKNKTIAHKY